MKSANDVAERRLLDRIAPPPEAENDPILGLVGTTYNLQPDFFDTDFLPALLGLGAWDDRGWTTRIAIEKRLQMMDSATILMEAKRYEGRPRSLRVEVVTAHGQTRQKLHAKVLIVLREQAVQLLVTSANLTEPGYRFNREAATLLTASVRSREQAPLIRAAVLGMQERLSSRLTEGAVGILKRADAILAGLSGDQSEDDSAFIWSGGPTPLWSAFLDHWPSGERIRNIVIVSPFWSEEGADGPLHSLIEEIARRGALEAGVTVRLLAEADKDSLGDYLPRLPASYATCNLSAHGVRTLAEAVDPAVPPEEVDMRNDFLGTRSLHAKVVLLEGPDSSLAYAGSANFTHSGWGFMVDPSRANIEAGIILRRNGRGRADVRDLVPATVGQAVELGLDKTGKLAPPEPSSTENPWPDFIAEIVLAPVPDREEELALMLRVLPDRALGQWSIGLAEKGSSPARTLATSAEQPSCPPDQWRVSLDGQILARLLIDQEVMVYWWGWPQGRPFPINVVPAARTSLPICPGSPDLKEEHLVAYYQGRIRWEDLFPDPEAVAKEDLPAAQQAAPGSDVDTSRIQSYQIREFVEALAGIRSDLREAGQSEPAMRMALLGPVSPVALVRTVMAAVKAGSRTPTAAAFQLVETLACIDSARDYPVVRRLEKAWREALDKAAGEIQQFLCRMREEHPDDLRAGGAFDRYQKCVCACSRDKEGRP